MVRRYLSLAVGALLLIVAACGGSSTPTTTVPPTTTSTTPPTSPPSTTTTTVPSLTYAGDGTHPEIDAIVEGVYRHITEGEGPPPLPDGLADLIGEASPPPALSISATTTTADLKFNKRVAVVEAGDDSILLADGGEGWAITGAHLASVGLEPWYGPALSTVLIIGSDARWNEAVDGARSDSLHILTAVPSAGAGAIVGIPRDSWVVTPSGGNGKITDVLANHGPEGVFETVQRISGAPLNGWVMTGFLGFEVMSRAFGPFEIDLPRRIPSSRGFPGFPEGPQIVEPAENLLLLARIRKPLPNGDFDRSFNHGVILQGALRRVQELGIAALPELVQILDDSSFTNLSAGQLLNLAATSLLLDPGLVDNVVVPGSVGTTSGGASIVRIGAGADAVFADQADDGLLNDSAG